MKTTPDIFTTSGASESMAKFTFIGTDRYTKQLEKLAAKDDGVLKYAVYPGAAVVADAIRGTWPGLK